ncbi:MAG: serine/threonine-protein kinase, partial [Planctomycetota bacterium]|nr:serine/threonine-protein kinase [Planctomycetota bacterium]
MTRNEWQIVWLQEQGWVSRDQIAQINLKQSGLADGSIGLLLLNSGLLDKMQFEQLGLAEAQNSSQNQALIRNALQIKTIGSNRGELNDTPNFNPISNPGQRQKLPMLTSGTLLGGYLIDCEISRGGMGVVFRARGENGQLFAVKTILNDRHEKREVQRFEREAKVLSQLSHPNIVRFHRYGMDQGRHFLAMDFIEGETLHDLVTTTNRGCQFDVWDWIDLFCSLAKALSYCHELGVIHRDLKPYNVIIREGNGQPVLVDFGLIKKKAGSDVEMVGLTHSLSTAGEQLGTFTYMSPEQVEGQELGPASDVWSFGALMYYCLSGQSAFQGCSPLEIQAAIL